MLSLSGFGLEKIGRSYSERPFVGRICEWANSLYRDCEILRVTDPHAEVPGGFLAYLYDAPPVAPPEGDAFLLPLNFRYLREGDIVRINAVTGAITTLYRVSSRSNALLVTERCSNRCIMCSQPPTERNDAWLIDEAKEIVSLIASEPGELGITGGEPGLLGPKLIELLEFLKEHLPRTAVHLLSNGRAFSHRELAVALAQVNHPDLMVGVPLHSILPEEHDYIAQAYGAFDETVRGILNLKSVGARVELRFVIHAESSGRLLEFAEFIARNLLFVDHVALMGMELEGFARTNVQALWIDPLEYGAHLLRAVQHLAWAGLRVSIYNLPLCVLPDELHPFARQSISDWKTTYIDECARCTLRAQCCGLFASGVTVKSRGILAR
ncbi:MAG TPA: His-Xaa-Ser system radical SAM maturase HxsC [Polyangiaceae bacterium]